MRHLLKSGHPTPLKSPLSLARVVELVEWFTSDTREVDIILYGSTAESGQVVGDLDIWLDGDPKMTAYASSRLSEFGYCYGVEVDIASPTPAKAEFDAAVRMCVSRFGIVIAGAPPAGPQISDDDAALAYRRATRSNAKELAHSADVLARAGVPPTEEFMRTTVQAWLRSLAQDRLEERTIKRESLQGLVRRVESIDEDLARLIIEYGWTSSVVSSALADRLLDCDEVASGQA